MTYIEDYDAVRRRLESVVVAADPLQAVPTCPGWSIWDVLAHLVGLCEDWVRGRFDGYASEEWTAAHLERHRGESCASLLDTWRAVMIVFAEVDDSPLGETPARWAFGDAVIHEGDLRGATIGGRVPGPAVDLSLQGSMHRWQQTLQQAGLGGVRLVLPDGREFSGAGSPDHEDTVELVADPYEVFRGLAGRRSAAQVANWAWSEDPGPYLVAGPPYPFGWARVPIVD